MKTPDKHTEIEAKLPVVALEPVSLRLQELGAKHIGIHTQVDDYFDNGQQQLATSDCCLRLRQERDTQTQRLCVTYKGPKQQGQFKRRQELEFSVSEPEAVRMLFAVLGYQPALVVKKTRDVWEFNHCQIGLDLLPALGTFVEIEGPDEQTIDEVQTALGLAEIAHEPESYASLIAKQNL